MTNNLNKIDQAIKSRSLSVEIKDPPIVDIIEFMKKILEEEGVSYEEGTLVTFVQSCYPDIRKTMNEIKGHCNDNHLESGDIISTTETVNKVLTDLRMHMAFYNIDKKEIYGEIKDKLEVQVSERQIYYLLSGKNLNKIKMEKQIAIVNCIKANIPVKKWFSEYMRLNE